MSDSGTLTLVAAPIGNLSDTTARAIEVLTAATHIACEDTRVTGKLLSKLGIENSGKLISYREQNESYMAGEIADRMEAGEDIGREVRTGQVADVARTRGVRPRNGDEDRNLWHCHGVRDYRCPCSGPGLFRREAGGHASRARR